MALLVGAISFSQISHAKEVMVDDQWLRLLRYHKKLLGGYKSEADGIDFFLHPQGKSNPERELQELIYQLESDSSDEAKSAFCRFPARVRWLRARGVDVRSSLKCEKLNEFRTRLSALSISVVFSSYYLDNPSSSFGHTFIRIGKNKNDDSTATELLDTGINYGAVTGNAGPVVYTIGGLTGLFPGTFNAIPYYYKVREYNDFESRDLWSYELNFSQPEIDFIVDHIWELGHTHFDYYFLTENCSYHVLTILDAARPSINLSRYMSSLYVIPSDTLKALDKEGLISNVKFRPSPSSLFKYHLDQISTHEVKSLRTLVEKPEKVADVAPERQVLMMDSALAYVDFKYAKELIKEEAQAVELKKPILLQRARLGQRSPEANFSEKRGQAPHLGHGSNRLALSYIDSEKSRSTDLEWRFAFHDYLDYDLAYPPHMKLEVMRFNLRSTSTNDIELRELAMLDVVSLGDYNQYGKSPSWKVKIGQSLTNYQNQELTTAGMNLGYGVAKTFQAFTPFVLTHLEVGYLLEKYQHGKLGFGFDYGLLVDFSAQLKFLTQYNHRLDHYADESFFNEIRFSNRHTGLGLQYKRFIDIDQKEFSIRYFIYL